MSHQINEVTPAMRKEYIDKIICAVYQFTNVTNTPKLISIAAGCEELVYQKSNSEAMYISGMNAKMSELLSTLRNPQNRNFDFNVPQMQKGQAPAPVQVPQDQNNHYQNMQIPMEQHEMQWPREYYEASMQRPAQMFYQQKNHQAVPVKPKSKVTRKKQDTQKANDTQAQREQEQVRHFQEQQQARHFQAVQEQQASNRMMQPNHYPMMQMMYNQQAVDNYNAQMQKKIMYQNMAARRGSMTKNEQFESPQRINMHSPSLDQEKVLVQQRVMQLRGVLAKTEQVIETLLQYNSLNHLKLAFQIRLALKKQIDAMQKGDREFHHALFSTISEKLSALMNHCKELKADIIQQNSHSQLDSRLMKMDPSTAQKFMSMQQFGIQPHQVPKVEDQNRNGNKHKEILAYPMQNQVMQIPAAPDPQQYAQFMQVQGMGYMPQMRQMPKTDADPILKEQQRLQNMKYAIAKQQQIQMYYSRQSIKTPPSSDIDKGARNSPTPIIQYSPQMRPRVMLQEQVYDMQQAKVLRMQSPKRGFPEISHKNINFQENVARPALNVQKSASPGASCTSTEQNYFPQNEISNDLNWIGDSLGYLVCGVEEYESSATPPEDQIITTAAKEYKQLCF